MKETKKRGMTVWYLLSILAVIAADQGLKAWTRARIPLNPTDAETVPFIPGFIRFSHIHNTGSAFSMLQGARWGFLALLAVFTVVVIWALRTNKLTKGWERWFAVLALGGALANGIDRALYGYVVDMLELQFMRFAVFNLADFVINVSCIAFCLLMLFSSDKEKKKEPSAETKKQI